MKGKCGFQLIHWNIYFYNGRIIFKELPFPPFLGHLPPLSYLPNNNSKDINYIYGLTTVGDYFQNDKSPIIIVKDDKNLIGKLITVTFQINNGSNYSSIFNSKLSINIIKEEFLSKFQLYLFEDKIQFFYNNHPIKFENTILLFDYLKNHYISPKEKNFSIENYF